MLLMQVLVVMVLVGIGYTLIRRWHSQRYVQVLSDGVPIEEVKTKLSSVGISTTSDEVSRMANRWYNRGLTISHLLMMRLRQQDKVAVYTIWVPNQLHESHREALFQGLNRGEVIPCTLYDVRNDGREYALRLPRLRL